MCKYREALDVMYTANYNCATVPSYERVDPKFQNEWYSNQKELDLLQELVDKEEAYRWHDLRVNPKDLPQTNEFECVVAELWEDGHITYDIMSDFVVDYDDTFYPYKKTRTIGWKYIEDFWK